ncbi:MAG: aminoacyl--tRNA ligase-related protein, partial [Bacilli bacterium]
MKLKESFFYTIREDQKDEDSKSSNLLVRSGMIKKVGAGIYMFMPLGLKAIQNIEKIVREEINKEGGMELLMPSLLPIEVYEKSGRVNTFGKDMFRLDDRANRHYALGPTHEELFCMAAKEKVKSYKDLPFNIYQFGNKYRDEARSRYGLIRVREFIMKDGYSF